VDGLFGAALDVWLFDGADVLCCGFAARACVCAEPSTGMDPVSRRFMWDVIAGVRARQSSVILTTHSMEEAEALCTRIGIMVNGQLQCLGTTQHLKSKYGTGFEVEVKTAMPSAQELDALYVRVHTAGHSLVTRPDLAGFCAALGRPEWDAEVAEKGGGAVLHAILEADGTIAVRAFAEWWVAQGRAEALQAFLVRTFGEEVRLLERAGLFSFRYNVPGGQLSLAEIFRQFEARKAEIGISEYSVGQTTLEQLFNRFAALQEHDERA
jgi:ATP-binding cassette, subfamily A (ABC1), member 3